MGCVASKLGEEEEVVSICRERKHYMKEAVERRTALAEAHCRYCQSLYAVAAAIRLFVARHASPSSPYLITLPPPCPSSRQPPEPPQPQLTENPMFIEQAQSQTTVSDQSTTTTQEPNDCCGSCGSTTTSSDSYEEDNKQDDSKQEEQLQGYGYLHTHHQPGYGYINTKQEEHGYGYYYMQVPEATPPMPQLLSPQRDYGGWDFFNPFETMRQAEIISGYRRISDDDLRVVREEEGIPELEEEVERVVVVEEKGKVEVEETNHNVSDVVKVVDEPNDVEAVKEEDKELNVIDCPENGRDLLEALGDIVDHFVGAFDSGKEVSRMLEASNFYLQSGVEGIKENSTKLAITWHRSTSSKPSSCKSLVTSSSKSSSWTEFKNDLFDDHGGMNSGSHSSTLGRLYAWEKKLYEEVKAGDDIRRIYEKKCSRLRNHDVSGDDELSMDKTRSAVKDLYARILVAIRSAESISKRIEKLRDEELQPQIVELLKGLTHTWKIMLESHETQSKIIFDVKSFACSAIGKHCNELHRLATLQLEAELQNWRVCFIEYIAAQKRYVQALEGWLSKFLVPEVEFYSRGRRSAAPYRATGPPLLMICHDWLSTMENLPDRAVSVALKSFSRDVRALWAQQGEELQQKRKVENLAKEFDRRTVAFKKAETRFLDSKLLEYHKSKPDPEQRLDYLSEKKEQLDSFRKKLDTEMEKHQRLVQETQRTTLNGFQTGFSTVFESLTEFAKVNVKMYNSLVECRENAGKAEKQSYIEGSEASENGTK